MTTLEGTYERISAQLLKGQEKNRDYHRKIGRLVNGHLCMSHASLHKTPQSRRWRAFWRLKSQRQTPLSYFWSSKP